MRKIISVILYVVAAVVIVSYILGSVCPYISPQSTTLLAYFGLAYPAVWCAMVAILIVSLSTRHWKLSVLITIMLIASFSQWRNTIVAHPVVKKRVEGKELKVLTYNVGMFNVNKDLDAFVDFVKETNADVVCLQEFGFYSRAASQNDILQQFDKLYPHRHLWYKNQSNSINSGLATFSRYPIIKKEKIQYESTTNVSIFSDIVVSDDTIRVINNHLESYHLNEKERDIIGLLRDSISQDEKINHSRHLENKLSYAMKIRASQAEAIRYTVSKTHHRVVVVGDFNDVAQSYTYRVIAAGLTDAFSTAGRWGYNWTFHTMPMYFALDHILTSPTIQATEAIVHHIKLSDHYPLTATFQIK